LIQERQCANRSGDVFGVVIPSEVAAATSLGVTAKKGHAQHVLAGTATIIV
jgi:hypothetical protein